VNQHSLPGLQAAQSGQPAPALGPTPVDQVKLFQDLFRWACNKPEECDPLTGKPKEPCIKTYGWLDMGYTYSSSGHGPLSVEPRPNHFGNEFTLNQIALTIEKLAVSMAIGLIVMVAALNIVATLILLVMEKHRDIAILKTMGASARSVTMIFMMQGLIIGIVGTMVGAAAGYVLSYILDRYKLISVPVDVYQVSHVPFKVQPEDFALVIVAAIVVCFVATIYPSRQAARLDPAQALRYE